MSNNICVLSIDIGYAIIGWSIINIYNRVDYSLVKYGCIENSNISDSIESRIYSNIIEIELLIDKYKPNHLVIESLFFFKNKKTAIDVAQSRGALLFLGKKKNLQIYSYTPLKVKNVITGYGKSTKKDVHKSIKEIFGDKVNTKQDDIIDAIAIGMCHFKEIIYKN